MQILTALRFIGAPITYELRGFFISWDFSNGNIMPNLLELAVSNDYFEGGLE